MAGSIERYGFNDAIKLQVLVGRRTKSEQVSLKSLMLRAIAKQGRFSIDGHILGIRDIAPIALQKDSEMTCKVLQARSDLPVS